MSKQAILDVLREGFEYVSQSSEMGVYERGIKRTALLKRIATVLDAPDEPTDASLTLRICTAYESGFGQAGRKVDNPYKFGISEAEAWNIGYQEGPKRAPHSEIHRLRRKIWEAASMGLGSEWAEQAIGAASEPPPIPMILHCPRCHAKHIDAPQPEKGWSNPPHRSHECQSCQFVWRPADVPTVGVDKIETRGQHDSRSQRCAGTISTDPPQDCDWPFCGCDHHATKVLEALQECGWSRGDAEDAAKWRALRNCARITTMGCAGLHDPDALARPDAHLALNFWTHNERETEPFPRQWLDQFVEKALRLTKVKP